MGREGRAKPVHRVLDHALDQLLLGREVVVQRGDVDAGLGCDLAGAQPFEAARGELVVRGAHQCTAAILLRRRFGHGVQLST